MCVAQVDTGGDSSTQMVSVGFSGEKGELIVIQVGGETSIELKLPFVQYQSAVQAAVADRQIKLQEESSKP